MKTKQMEKILEDYDANKWMIEHPRAFDSETV